jgi:hypothetical protein
MESSKKMTLWKRIGAGVGLCSGWFAALFAFDWLIGFGSPVLQYIAGLALLVTLTLGSVFFGIGVLIIIGGIVAHTRDAIGQHKDA